MKKKRIWILTVLCLFLLSLLGGCGAGQAQNKPSGGGKKETEPFSIKNIRTAQLTDVKEEDTCYDTVCYMLYYKLMDAEEGAFAPDRMLTQKEAAQILSRLDETVEKTDSAAPVTRVQLAQKLYTLAKNLGYDTKCKLESVSYRDADKISQDALEAVLWAEEKGVFRCIAEEVLLPNTAVSRLQLAQALIALKALDETDVLAAEILEALPQRQVKSNSRKNHDAIQQTVDTAAKSYGAMGLQVAVIEDGVLTDTYAYGWATRNTTPMTPDHKIRIASISKVAVGITAQLLREEGVVDLDADISQYWGVQAKNPEHKDKPITLRGMLTHTSSIVNAGDNTSREYGAVKAKLQSGGYSSAVPGDIGYWSYNNYAFAVLGMTLELAADRVVDDILQEKLYIPMDIDAAFGSGDIKNTNLLATLYRGGTEVSRTVEAQKALHSSKTPGASGTYFAGGMTSSVTDLGKLIALLANDGKYEGVQLLQPESVEMMEKLHSEKSVSGGSYQALPMRYWPDLYGRKGIYFHTGSAYGVFNCACYDPETGDGVVVLSVGASGAKDEYGIYKVCAAINQEVYNVLQH